MASQTELLGQAQQLWSMLDDMAVHNPDAYKAFIEKQRAEHQRMSEEARPPQPVFAAATTEVILT